MHRSAALIALGALSSPAAAEWFKSNYEASWEPPQQTGIYGPEAGEQDQIGLGWSPAPTGAPALEGAMDMGFALGKRALKSTVCGFGTSGNSFTCINSASAVCNYSKGYVGCCETGRSCNSIKTTCVDYASSASICNFLEDFHTICCSSAAPACFTYVGTSDGDAFTLFDCSARKGTASLLFSDPLAETSTTSADETSTTGDASSTDDASSTTDSAAASSSTDANKDDNGGGSSTNVGAIAGGVVGGVAALGLIGLAAFLLFRRRKKTTPAATPLAGDAAQNQPPMAQNPQHPQSPGGNSFVPSSPSNAAYPSGVPSNFQNNYQQGYDPSLAAPYGQPQGYTQPGYSGYSPQPQAFQGQYAPQQGYDQQGQYPSQYGPGAYGAPSTSPPPQFTPSPGPNKTGHEIPHGGQQQNAQELPAVNPLGNEGNRAELS
ncbi:hypothetical protein DER45DRAFT_179899 [Fusarium avenaceum]|nr:hypothetical protein DER45DRAFT_179899 [Fusarium avenaceum]